jgi:hypothetical protein
VDRPQRAHSQIHTAIEHRHRRRDTHISCGAPVCASRVCVHGAWCGACERGAAVRVCVRISQRRHTPGSVVDAVRVGAVGACVERARPALRVRGLREPHTGRIRLGLKVQHRQKSDGAELPRRRRGHKRQGRNPQAPRKSAPASACNRRRTSRRPHAQCATHHSIHTIFPK